MAHVSLFIGGIRPLPESGRPTGMYKQPATGPLELGSDGFVGDEQADRRVHGGPEKAVHLYPARHYTQLAERFPEAAPAFWQRFPAPVLAGVDTSKVMWSEEIGRAHV